MKIYPFTRLKLFVFFVVLLVAVELSAACQGDESDLSPVSQESPVATSETESLPEHEGDDDKEEVQPELDESDPEVISSQWAAGAHASTFVVSADGKNNYCARCHAPIEWLPTLEDLPESCSSCKFELSEPPAYIAEEQWQSIPCKVCHQIDKKGDVQAEVNWLEVAALEEYATVENPNELCLECHSAVNVREHVGVAVEGAHQDFLCSNCHNAHGLTASCGDSECHERLQDPQNVIPGHDQNHRDVACEACHDGSGWVVGPHEETGIWTTFAPWAVDGEGNPENGSIAFTSHHIILESACERCHFSDNPWDLSAKIEIP